MEQIRSEDVLIAHMSVAVALGSSDRAIVLERLAFYIRRHERIGKHWFDGHTWNYLSRRAAAEEFPWLTDDKIRGCLKKLVDDGYLLVGVYNANKRDRTKWYALTDKARKLLRQAPERPEPAELPHWGKSPDCIGENPQWVGENPQWVGENPQPLPVDYIPVIDNSNRQEELSNDNSLEREGGNAPSPTPRKKQKKFVPPSVEDVRAYVNEKGLSIDAKRFVDYYEAADWHDGQGRPVKNWKQKLLMWANHEQKGEQHGTNQGGNRQAAFQDEWWQGMRELDEQIIQNSTATDEEVEALKRELAAFSQRTP